VDIHWFICLAIIMSAKLRMFINLVHHESLSSEWHAWRSHFMPWSLCDVLVVIRCHRRRQAFLARLLPSNHMFTTADTGMKSVS